MTNERENAHDIIVCDWCGQVTRMEWCDGVGYCRACHRELSKDDGRGSDPSCCVLMDTAIQHVLKTQCAEIVGGLYWPDDPRESDDVTSLDLGIAKKEGAA